MRILLLTDSFPPEKLSGVAEIAYNLKKTYESFGHTVFVLTSGKARKDDALNHVERPSRNLFISILLNNFLILKYLFKYKIDVLHLHHPTFVAFLILKIFKPVAKFPKIISSFQVTYFSEFNEVRPVKIENRIFTPKREEYIQKIIFSPIHIIADFFCYCFADIVTVISSEMKREVESTYGRIFKKRIIIIPNGVDLEQFSGQTSYRNTALEDKIRNKKVIIYTGAFRVRKRVFNLLFALKGVVKNFPNAVLILIGGGRGYEEDIRQLIKDLELEDNVILTGKVSNDQIPYYMSLADIFCLVSSYEGLPMALLEAMAMKKAIITTRVSGMVDVIEDNVSGLLVAVDDIQELEDSILNLLNNKDKLQRLSLYAYNTVIQNYTWDKIARSYLNTIK